MKKIWPFIVVFIVIACTFMYAAWTTPEVINATYIKKVGDTTTSFKAKSQILPSKVDLQEADSITYFVTAPSPNVVVLKQVRFVLNKATLDTVTILTKAAGKTYASATIACKSNPKSVFFEQYEASVTLGAADTLRPYLGQVTATIIYNKK